MINKIINYFKSNRDQQRIAIALAKGGAMMLSRSVDLKHPSTWEFSGFSQNGEDGILDVLRKKLLKSNRYFIEIGAADGIENNSAWLVIAEKYNGLTIEGNPKIANRAQQIALNYNIGVKCTNMFVTLDTIPDLKKLALHHDPDVFSLDIDGNDYFIAKALFENGIFPKIFAVEYNSAYGPDKSITIQYQESFSYTDAHPTHLYYGVSLQGWINFFNSQGYRFVTVDTKGVNAFFVHPDYFDSNFLDNISPVGFTENQAQFIKFKSTHSEQFSLISDQLFFSIPRV